MKRLASAMVLSVALAAGATAANAEVLRVGTECTYAPFNYRTADGELTGYDVDVAREVGKRISADIEFVCQEWDGMIPALLANKFDLIVASMSITDKRLKQIDFSGPYRVSIGQFVGRKDANLKLFDDEGEVIPGGFEGLRVGLERSSTYEEWVKAKVPGRRDRLLRRQRAHVPRPRRRPGRRHHDQSDEGLPQVPLAGRQRRFRRDRPRSSRRRAYFGIGVGIGLRKDQAALKGRITRL